MKEFWQSLNKFYFVNFSIFAALILSIVLMFTVQFKVEALQDEMVKVENEISSYEDEIQLLEVEWVYLTRPARLRTLAANYLQNNGYVLASQIKNENELKDYYFANYQKVETKESFPEEEKQGI
jgi:cell division protein FtsL